jgi:ribonuclease E
VAALGAEQPDLNAPPPLGDNFPAVQMEIALAPAPLTPPSDPLPAEAAPIAFTHTDIAAPEPVMAEPSVVDPVPMTTEITEPVASETAPAETEAAAEEVASITTDEEGDAKPRRRGRRGGRRRRRDEGDEVPVEAAEAGPAPVMPPAYDGPTPADPFGRQPFDIFDVMDQVEQAHLSPAPEPAPPADVAVSPQAASHVESAPAVEPPVTPVPNGLHLVETIPSPPAPVEPLVKPVLINAPAQDRKRGWWRR